MEKLILTDGDGCRLDWFRGFTPWMSKLGYEPVADVKAEEMYALHVKYGTAANVMHKLVYDYNSSDAMGSLEPYKDAADVMPRLARN